MAYSSIIKPGDYFNTKLYTGNGTDNNATQSINMGLQPDLTWIKNRNLSGASAQSHHIFDNVRGGNLRLMTDSSLAESDKSDRFNGITSTGFDLVQDDAGTNQNNQTYVAWGWKANGSTTVSNTDGTITSNVSVNTTAGFSIVSYTGNGTSGATIGHGLGTAPSWILVKKRAANEDWVNYHSSLTADYYMYFTTNASTDDATKWNDTEPTSSVFSVGNHASVNTSSSTYIAYCFAEKKGYSKFGKYTGNGNANGTFVYTGFKPAWIMIKRTDATNNWGVFDNKRNLSNPVDKLILPNSSNAEDGNNTRIDMYSNGFKPRINDPLENANGGSYIYMAFAENPLVVNVSGGLPATAR